MKTPNVDQLVARTCRSLLLADMVGHTLRAVVVIAVAIAAAVIIDAGYALPGYALVLLDVALLVVLARALCPLVARLWQGPCNDRQAALLAEQRLNIPDNRLINALDLARQDAHGTSASLREAAIAHGESAAREAVGRPVIDRDALKQAAKPAAVAAIVLLLAYVLLPSVFHAVVPRLFSPLGDHPPFTRIKFDIRTEPEPIYHGKPATIRVALSGPNIPERAHVVFINDGVKSSPLPMHRTQPPWQDEAGTVPAHHYALRVDRAEATRSYYIDTPDGRSALHTLTVDTSPLIERAGVGYDYPDYTGWADTTGPLPRKGIRALAGTHINLSIESNVPLDGGELRIVPGDETSGTPGTPGVSDHIFKLSPHPIDPRSAEVSFQLDMPGRYELTLIGADGKPGVETLTGGLIALPDRAPKIDIVEPQRQAVAPEGWRVEARLLAGDDIGIGPIVMHQGLNDTPTTPTPLRQTTTGINRTVAQARHTFDLSQLGARAGDVVRYYAAVTDNHPDAPRFAETPVHAIHIITLQQYLDLARTQYRIDDLGREFEGYIERLAELEAKRSRLLEELSGLADRLNAGEPLTDAQREQLAGLEASLAAYAEQASALADDLQERAGQSALYAFEERYKQMLAGLGSQLDAQGEQAEALASALEALRASDTQDQRQAAGLQAERFALLNEPFTDQSRRQTQAVEQDLEKLRLAEAMLTQGARIRRIAREQDELAVRVSGLAEPGGMDVEGQRRAEVLAEQQTDLRDELNEARVALQEAAEQAGESLPNMSSGAVSVADRIAELRIVPTQAAARKALLAGNGPLAHQAAREAADKLDSLLSDVAQGQSQASSDLDGCFLLPREQIQSALQQMAVGRGLPSMGTQGGSGVGMSGSFAQMSMIGPAMPGQPGGDSATRQGQRGTRGGTGQPGSDADPAAEPAEVIHAEASAHSAQGVSRLPGVPAEYREQAEAYFKRIAEEQR